MTLIGVAGVFLLGVFIAQHVQASGGALGLFLLASVFLLALLVSLRRSLIFPGLLAVVLLLGMLRGESSLVDQPSPLTLFHERHLLVQGVVVSDPEAAGSATRFRFDVDRIRSGDTWADESGDVLVTVRASAELAGLREGPYFRYGDRLELEGTLDAPPEIEEFDYPTYLARRGISSMMSFPEPSLVGEGDGIAFYRWLYSVRQHLADSLTRVVPEPQASLGQALLLGLRQDLPEDLVDDFRSTGTSHVLAISGLHIGILLGLSLTVSRHVLGRRRQLYLILPLVLIWLYALISGMSPSAARAAIMGTVYLAALFVGRPSSVVPALGFAAALMVAVNPNVLWSISFQLSFAAMEGIAVLSEPISERIQARYSGWFGRGSGLPSSPGLFGPSTAALPGPPTMVYAASMTIAAILATLPLVAFYFREVSLVGLPTSLLVLPALPLAVVTQATAGLLGLLSSGLAQPFGWLAWLVTAYMSGVVGLVARLPGASIDTGPVAPVLVWAYYGVFVLWYTRVLVRRAASFVVSGIPRLIGPLQLPQKTVAWWVSGPVVAVAALLWIAAFSLPGSRLHVTFIDVGQGDAAFITTPNGRQIVVDGGPDPLEMVRFLGREMPFRDRSIDLVILTHAHADHLNGLVEVLRRYDVKGILEREVESDTAPYQAWRRAVGEASADVVQAQSGQLIDLGGGVILEVISPPAALLRGTASDGDNASIVLRLVYRDVSFLLTGDMFREAEGALVGEDVQIDSDVLKVGHHGSRTSSSEAFLDGVSPVAAVISAGDDNRFGHPHAETIQALLQYVPDNLLFQTIIDGTIEFITDGHTLEAKTERSR